MTRYGDTRELIGPPWADESRLGRPFAKDPSVVRFRGRYHLYFSLPPTAADGLSWERGEPTGWDVGVAVSDNLLSWERVGVLGRLGRDDPHGRAAPGAVVLDDRVHLFLQSFGNGAQDAILHAVSDDGITFTATHDGRAVFAPRGAWCTGRAIDADVTVFGDHLVTGYATRDPSARTQLLGFARAPLDSDFGPDAWEDLSPDAPALAPELGWEGECIEAPALCVRDGQLVAFYAGAYNNCPQQIGVATSPDGVQWQRQSDEPFLANGPPGSWNHSESGHPGLLVQDGVPTHLFFQGNADAGHTWYIAGVRLAWDGLVPRIVTDRDDPSATGATTVGTGR